MQLNSTRIMPMPILFAGLLTVRKAILTVLSATILRRYESIPIMLTPYNNRGVAYDDKGEFDRAVADYNKAIDLNPDYVDAYNNRGGAYHDKGEFDRAVADYNKAIDLKSDYAQAYNNRGLAYDKKGEFDRAHRKP